MSFSPNYSIYWLQLVTVLFSKKHVFPSSLKVILDTKTFLPGEQYFLHIFFIITLECSTFFRDLFLDIFFASSFSDLLLEQIYSTMESRPF